MHWFGYQYKTYSGSLHSNLLKIPGLELVSLRLPGGTNTRPPKGALLCSCNSVGRGNIEEEIKNGAKNLDVIMVSTGAGTGCGSCRPEVNQIIKQMLEHSQTAV